MTELEPVKPPVSAPSPDPSPQPSPVKLPPASERPIAAQSSASATSSAVVAEVESTPSARVARGRGEPHRPPAAPKAPREPGPIAERPVPPAANPPAPPAWAAAVPPISQASERWNPPPPPPIPSQVRDEAVPGNLAIEGNDSGYAPASRLGGLRNLLVSLGRKSLNWDGDSAPESDSDLEPRFERATLRPAYADTFLPDAGDSGAPVRLTAQPEILPPQPSAEVEKEKESVRPTPPRRDNPDGEEIQTLPSWRGQYRKKRYPPM